MKRHIRKHLEKLIKIERIKRHPLIHHIHKKYKISRKTLFYVKEYGQHSNVVKTILRESIGILILSAMLSSFGGIALEKIKMLFISITPLVIMLPTLNDMIGDYGTIVSSRFSTMLHEGKVRKKWWLENEIRQLFLQIFIVAMILSLISGAISMLISNFSGHVLLFSTVWRIFLIVFLDVALLVVIIFLVAIIYGLYLFRKGEDPNNFLIPITTSIADFGNMLVLAGLILLFF